MKKNEHYFPTMEWIKDPSDPCGWRRVTYEGGKVLDGEGAEGVPPGPADESLEMEIEAGPAKDEE